MPQMGVKSHLVSNGKAVQSVNPHQSAWLTHWTGTRSETIEHDHLTHLSRSKETNLNDHDFKRHPAGIEISSHNFGFSKDVDLTLSLKKPSSQLFQFFKSGQEYGKCSDLNERVQALGLGLGPQVSHKKLTSGLNVEISSRECHIQRTDQVKHHMFFSESNYLSLRPLDQVVYKLDSHTTHGPQTSHHGQCSSKNAPHFVHDVEMTKISDGLHSFCRTTHSLLLTKQTDVKVFQESQFCTESRLPTQLKEEAPRECKWSHSCFVHGQQGVKLQVLDSSDPASQESIEDYRASGEVQKNESSADTDAMDMDSFKKNHFSGVHLFETNKDNMAESNAEIDKCRKRKIEPYDINLEISAQPKASKSAEKAKPCMSNTNPGSEPGSKWIKRLKLSETSSHGKTNRFFTTVTEGKPEPESDKHHGERSESLTGKFFHKKSEIQIGEPSSIEIKRECNEISLSHSWIQRLTHKQNQKKTETLKTCELNSEPATDEFQKTQFPSVAALALMGKAMTRFPQCKLQKKKSLVVWGTKLSISNAGGVPNSVFS